MTELQTSILTTLTYFNLSSHPLTKEELFTYLWKPPQATIADVEAALNGLLRQSLVAAKDGYYFLPERDEIVAARARAQAVGEKKLVKAKRAVRVLASIPFLRAVFVSSSVASGTAREDSDIDFFIIAEKNRVWVVRFFSNLLLRLLGWRVYGKKRKDRVCLCFFVDTGHLDLSPWKISDNDIHFIYWLNQMKPLYDTGGWHHRFLESNQWTLRSVPHIRIPLAGNPELLVQPGRLGGLWKAVWEKMWQGSYGDLVEKQAEDFQLERMKASLKEKATLPNHHVVLKSGVLKLHENDRREWYSEKMTKV